MVGTVTNSSHKADMGTGTTYRLYKACMDMWGLGICKGHARLIWGNLPTRKFLRGAPEHGT